MIKFQPINEENQAYWQQVYYEAFPEAERIDFDKLFPKSNYPAEVKLATIVEDQTNVGIILLVDMQSKAFILYLAVDANIRGRGIGRKVLDELKLMYPDGFILESESLDVDANNREQRLARYAFYERNGLIDTGIISHNMSGAFHLLTSKRATNINDYLKATKVLNIQVKLSDRL